MLWSPGGIGFLFETSPSAPLTFGGYASSTGPTIYDEAGAIIDEVSVYYEALTAQDVADRWAYYQAGPCTPDWSCVGYQECVSPATEAMCNNVTDINACGDIYSGNYSEFNTSECSYPSSSSSGTRYAVDADGNVVGVYQGTTLVHTATVPEPEGTFLSITGGEAFDIKAWWNDLMSTIRGWFQ